MCSYISNRFFTSASHSPPFLIAQMFIRIIYFERKIKKVFLDQLEAAYEKGKAGIDNVLREQEGKNSERVRQQEIVEQIKSKASFLLEGIR